MYSSTTPRRVKPLPKRRRTNHYYYPSPSSNGYLIPQNVNLPLNLPPSPPVPSLFPISDELLTQWRDFCLPLLGTAADALLNAGGLGTQVYSAGTTRINEVIEPDIVPDSNSPTPPTGGGPSPFPFSQLSPEVASQLTAQLESFVNLASATSTTTQETTNGPPPPTGQLDPITAAAYFTHHLNASLRATGLGGVGVGVGVGVGPFPPPGPPASASAASLTPPPPPPPTVSSKPQPRAAPVSIHPETASRDYREEEIDDRDDDRANGRNNTKKRKVPGVGVARLPSDTDLDVNSGERGGYLYSHSHPYSYGGGTGGGSVPVPVPVDTDTEGGGGDGNLENAIGDVHGSRQGGVEGEHHESRRLVGNTAKRTMSKVTLAGIQHKTRKKQLVGVLFRGSEKEREKERKSVSVSTELALDQMISDLTGLGIYGYPSLGLGAPPATLMDKPKVKVRLSKRESVRNARGAVSKRETPELSRGLRANANAGVRKANKENDVPSMGKKKKGKGGAAAATGGERERGVLVPVPVPKGKFTFSYRCATSDRVQATKEEVKLLRKRFEAEVARQHAKISGNGDVNGKGRGNSEAGAGSGVDPNASPNAGGRSGKKNRVASNTSTTGGASTTSITTTTTAPNIDTNPNANPAAQSQSQPPVLSPSTPSTPSKNVNKKKKKKRSALANASNPHHLRNYVPSRVPGITNSSNQHHNNQGNSGGNGGVNDPNELGPLPLRFLSAEIRGKKGGRKGEAGAATGVGNGSTTNLNGASAASSLNLTNPGEEWICAFCEYELFYGDEGDFKKAVRKRKAILRRRKRAREKAADKASGEASRRVRERQRELEKEQMLQSGQQQQQQQGSQGDGEESEPYEEDEYENEEEDVEEEDEEEEEEGYVESQSRGSAVRQVRNGNQ